MREHLPLKATPRTDYVYKRLVLPLPLTLARCKLEQTQSLQPEQDSIPWTVIKRLTVFTVIFRDVPS
jgi:hypothetical protein